MPIFLYSSTQINFPKWLFHSSNEEYSSPLKVIEVTEVTAERAHLFCLFFVLLDQQLMCVCSTKRTKGGAFSLSRLPWVHFFRWSFFKLVRMLLANLASHLCGARCLPFRLEVYLANLAQPSSCKLLPPLFKASFCIGKVDHWPSFFPPNLCLGFVFFKSEVICTQVTFLRRL